MSDKVDDGKDALNLSYLGCVLIIVASVLCILFWPRIATPKVGEHWINGTEEFEVVAVSNDGRYFQSEKGRWVCFADYEACFHKIDRPSVAVSTNDLGEKFFMAQPLKR